MTIYCCAVTHRPRWCVSLFLPHCLPPPGLHARYRGSHCWGQHPNYQGHSHNRAQGPRYISTTDTQNFNDKMSFKTRWKAGRFLQLIRYRGRSTSSHYQDFPIVWLGSLSKWSPGNEERELTGTPHMTADYPGQEMNVCIQANMSVATSSLGRGGGNEWEKKSPRGYASLGETQPRWDRWFTLARDKSLSGCGDVGAAQRRRNRGR